MITNPSSVLVLTLLCLLYAFRNFHHCSALSPKLSRRNKLPVLKSSQRDEEQYTTTIMFQDEEYDRIMPVARYANESHAIHGALLKDKMLELYEVYQPKGFVAPSEPSEKPFDLLVLLAKVNFGTHLNGHGGIVHGGIISLMFDDVMGWGCDRCLPEDKIPVTANLSIDFKRPLMAGTKVHIQVILEKWEGRKLFWKARMIDAEKTDEEVLYAEATTLYIILKDKK